jgi:membrane protease YdiL (CAAX protease family)
VGPRPVRWTVPGIVLASIALNVVTNSVLPARLHIPVSLATAVGVSLLGMKAGVTLEDQGMSRRHVPGGIAHGLAASAPIAFALAAASRHRDLRRLYQEQSIESASPHRALYEALVRIPFGTALPEEVIFRGTSMALLARRRSPAATILVSSALFGLWHIAPTAQRIHELPHVRRRPKSYQLAHIAASVAATALAGVALGCLRLRSGSIIAPWLAHTTANATGYVITWLKTRANPPGSHRLN